MSYPVKLIICCACFYKFIFVTFPVACSRGAQESFSSVLASIFPSPEAVCGEAASGRLGRD